MRVWCSHYLCCSHASTAFTSSGVCETWWSSLSPIFHKILIVQTVLLFHFEVCSFMIVQLKGLAFCWCLASDFMSQSRIHLNPKFKLILASLKSWVGWLWSDCTCDEGAGWEGFAQGSWWGGGRIRIQWKSKGNSIAWKEKRKPHGFQVAVELSCCYSYLVEIVLYP